VAALVLCPRVDESWADENEGDLLCDCELCGVFTLILDMDEERSPPPPELTTPLLGRNPEPLLEGMKPFIFVFTLRLIPPPFGLISLALIGEKGI